MDIAFKKAVFVWLPNMLIFVITRQLIMIMFYFQTLIAPNSCGDVLIHLLTHILMKTKSIEIGAVQF